jgi:hypothetical protein
MPGGRILDKISRKSSVDLQACGSLRAYICHILGDQGKAMMAFQMVMEGLVAS